MLNVPPDPDALPPVLDVEWNSHSKTCPGHVSRDVALAKIKTMLDAMQAHTGKRPIIYTDPVFYRDVLDGAFTDYHFWLRSVAAEPEALYRDRTWSFWQFTTTGSVPGVQGKVDRNSFNGPDFMSVDARLSKIFALVGRSGDEGTTIDLVAEGVGPLGVTASELAPIARRLINQR